MLNTIDRALAGAIDYVADDVASTVKSVREQGVRRTLVDAMGDAAGMVTDSASSVLSGRKGPPPVSTHSGMTGGYADIVAGRSGSNNIGELPRFQYSGPPTGGRVAVPTYTSQGGAVFPYEPTKPGGVAKAPPLVTGAFAPGIGIQRAPAGAHIAVAPASTAVGPAPGRAVPSSLAPPSGSVPAVAKGPTLSPDTVASRFSEIKQRHALNNICFDCGSVNPEWASVSFGIFVCIECSGHHRRMGTHISRIRSCKMDSWTETAIKIFDHGGNKLLADFFAANQVEPGERFQRYVTPAAEWYREAWIKNKALGREVPALPAGISAGPCTDLPATSVSSSQPPADLLDFAGGAPSKSEASSVARIQVPHDLLDVGGDVGSASQLPDDLLNLGGSAVSSEAKCFKASAVSNADLLDFGQALPCAVAAPTQAVASDTDVFGGGSGDLLGLGGLYTQSNAEDDGDPLGLHKFATDGPAHGSPPLSATPAVSSLAASTVAAVPLSAASTTVVFSGASPAANTLAGGARLQAKEENKVDDPFALALNKWGM